MRKTNVLRIVFIASVMLMIAAFPARAQIGSLTPVLIGSTGNFSSAGNVMLSASTGEPMVPTATSPSLILTQGFQQPSANGTLSLNASLVYTNVSCAGANDGFASVTPTGGSAPYLYTWSSSINDSLPTNDSLVPGTYTVTVTDAGGLSVTQSFTINDGSGICGIHVYSGLTPNGDGHNDTWIIDYIDLFLPNTVTIYNRWGVEVWRKDNYDNTTVVWDGKDMSGSDLPDGTYFYIIQVGDATMKDWVELSH